MNVKTFPITIRPVARHDYPAIANIDGLCFHDVTSEDEYRRFLLQNSSGGWVVEADGHVVAYLFYSVKLKYIQLHSIAVHPSYQRTSIGTQLIRKLKLKLEYGIYNYIRADVWEKNLPMQLFLKKCGFFCTEIIDGRFEPPIEEDKAYLMQYYNTRDNE